MAKLQTGPHHHADINEGTNAELLLSWCNGDLQKASEVAQATQSRHILWACDANPGHLAGFVRAAGYPHLIPANVIG